MNLMWANQSYPVNIREGSSLFRGANCWNNSDFHRSMRAILPNPLTSLSYLWKCEISWNSRAITRRLSRKLGDSTGKINWSQASEPLWFTLQSLLWTPASISALKEFLLSSFMFYTFKKAEWSRGRPPLTTTTTTPTNHGALNWTPHLQSNIRDV